MNEIKSRADLFEAAAKMMRMCDEARVAYVMKHAGVKCFLHDIDITLVRPSDCEMPLAIVEGKPVFVGDELYMKNPEPRISVRVTMEFLPDAFGNITVINDNGAVLTVNLSQLSLNPQKPKTVMVEMLRKDAEWLANNAEERLAGTYAIGRVGLACRKKLESEK